MLKSGVRLLGVRSEMAFVMADIRGIFESQNSPFVVTSERHGPLSAAGFRKQLQR